MKLLKLNDYNYINLELVEFIHLTGRPNYSVRVKFKYKNVAEVFTLSADDFVDLMKLLGDISKETEDYNANSICRHNRFDNLHCCNECN